MILSDREIRAALESGALRITPVPDRPSFTSTAVDLTLGAELRRWKEVSEWGVEARIRLKSLSFNITSILDNLTDRFIIPADGFELAPGGFVLGWTAERLQLPPRSRLAARVEGKSSLARLGLGVHVTAPTIHAGFGYNPEDKTYEGTPLQLEIWNIGKLPIVLDPGIAICQLIFEEVHGTPEASCAGTFATQGPSA